MKRLLILLLPLLMLQAQTIPFTNYSGDCQNSSYAPDVVQCYAQAMCSIPPDPQGNIVMTGGGVAASSTCYFPPYLVQMYASTVWPFLTAGFTIVGHAVVYKSFWAGIAQEALVDWVCNWPYTIIVIPGGTNTGCT